MINDSSNNNNSSNNNIPTNNHVFDIYWIRHAQSCANIYNAITYNTHPFLSQFGIQQAICLNMDKQIFIDKSKQISIYCSPSVRTITTALLAFRTFNYVSDLKPVVYIIPHIKEKSNSIRFIYNDKINSMININKINSSVDSIKQYLCNHEYHDCEIDSYLKLFKTYDYDDLLTLNPKTKHNDIVNIYKFLKIINKTINKLLSYVNSLDINLNISGDNMKINISLYTLILLIKSFLNKDQIFPDVTTSNYIFDKINSVMSKPKSDNSLNINETFIDIFSEYINFDQTLIKKRFIVMVINQDDSLKSILNNLIDNIDIFTKFMFNKNYDDIFENYDYQHNNYTTEYFDKLEKILEKYTHDDFYKSCSIDVSLYEKYSMNNSSELKFDDFYNDILEKHTNNNTVICFSHGNTLKKHVVKKSDISDITNTMIIYQSYDKKMRVPSAASVLLKPNFDKILMYDKDTNNYCDMNQEPTKLFNNVEKYNIKYKLIKK